jgi:hypothetical protein
MENLEWIGRNAFAFANAHIVMECNADGSEGVLKWPWHLNNQHDRVAKFAARCGYKIEPLPLEHMVYHRARIMPR